MSIDSSSTAATQDPAGRSSDAPFLPVASEQTPTLSVVIPTLNEEEGIKECMQRVETAVRDLGVTAEVIVSDSSTDRTPEIARSMGAIVVEPDRPGYGYAYRYAFEQARGDYLVMGDADTTYDFEAIPQLFRELQDTGADIVMGSRLEGEIKPGSMPALHQYVGNPLLTKFLNLFYGAGVSDAHSGFRLFTREALETMELETTGMEFASEMIMEAGAKDLEIAEVPITYHEREGEETLESFKDGWRHVRFMLMNAPDYLFSVPALGFGLIGVLTMVLSLVGGQVGGFTFGTHTAIAGSLLTIVAYQIGSLAVFSAVITDTIRDPRGPITGWVASHGRLEHGLFAGGALAVSGGIYVVAMIARWIESGFTRLPFIVPNMLAFTAIVLGIQTVFFAFFLSMLGAES